MIPTRSADGGGPPRPDGEHEHLRELRRSVDGLRRTGPPSDLARALRTLGEAERRSDPVAARRHYEEAVSLFRKLADPLTLAHTVRHLGDVHYEAGHRGPAEACYVEALDIYRGHGASRPLDRANAVRSLAVLRHETEDVEEAWALWSEACDIYAALAIHAGVAESAARLALLAARRGDRESSEAWLDRARSAARDSGDVGSAECVREVAGLILGD